METRIRTLQQRATAGRTCKFSQSFDVATHCLSFAIPFSSFSLTSSRHCSQPCKVICCSVGADFCQFLVAGAQRVSAANRRTGLLALVVVVAEQVNNHSTDLAVTVLTVGTRKLQTCFSIQNEICKHREQGSKSEIAIQPREVLKDQLTDMPTDQRMQFAVKPVCLGAVHLPTHSLKRGRASTKHCCSATALRPVQTESKLGVKRAVTPIS